MQQIMLQMLVIDDGQSISRS